jgi:hypothetical protein
MTSATVIAIVKPRLGPVFTIFLLCLLFGKTLEVRDFLVTEGVYDLFPGFYHLLNVSILSQWTPSVLLS